MNIRMALPKVLTLFFVVGVINFAHADKTSELSVEELSIQDKAAKRLYPGGPDESDIEVREGVAEAKQKLSRREIERDVYKKLFKEEMKTKVGDDESAPEDESEE